MWQGKGSFPGMSCSHLEYWRRICYISEKTATRMKFKSVKKLKYWPGKTIFSTGTKVCPY